MLQLDALGRHIGRKIKNRGRDYFETNSVSIVYEDDAFVSAEVRGTRTYDVDLERENKSLITPATALFSKITLMFASISGQHCSKWKSRESCKTGNSTSPKN